MNEKETNLSEIGQIAIVKEYGIEQVLSLVWHHKSSDKT
jgi:hypothetical protein